MSCYKPKKSPYWHYDFQFEGVRFHGSTGCTARGAARRVEARKREQAAIGELTAARPPMTLDDAGERYFQEVAKDQASADLTDTMLDRLTRGLGPATLLSEIGDKIETYIARRRGQRARHKKTRVANATVNREIELLRRVVRRAETTWKRDAGAPVDWSALRLVEPEERARELTPDEEVALFAALRDDFHAFVRFALMTGLRLGNIIGLTWRQVDWHNLEVRVRLKGRDGARRILVVPLTPALVAILSAQRGHHAIFVFTYRCRRSRGRRRKGQRYPFSPGGWRKDWKAALERAGIEDFRFHDTRHTDASRTLRATGNLELVRKKLGHASIVSTTRYAHVVTDDIRAAMVAMETDADSRNSPEPETAAPAKPLKRKA